ncbi:hypothetical protein OG585_44620 [Streptomyces sp. NBC_01340]|nr:MULTISPECIES: hypothetical protein [unclassified Streptomyces]MCX4459819.1 hypothetical protein [Streptomyces sp. NBC_01719]MCX4499177.1 hypothetical protein [Streptomyces sp. NBC_01728]MCX4594907.1 hypothetical protein [Streptomyces sp. NBC_01549]WSI43589.1 hypothetical protein OG585_44620 [Streptomyces sp. NBC_01340]
MAEEQTVAQKLLGDFAPEQEAVAQVQIKGERYTAQQQKTVNR